MDKLRLLFALLMTACASGSWAGPVIISPTQSLEFGSMVAGAGGSITIGVNPIGRTSSGGALVLPSGTWSAAAFQVSGDALATYSISLPADGTVFLSSGNNSMAVNNFTSNPSNSGDLGNAGSQTLRVGATLSVASNQPTGNYSGTFNVTVNYN